MRRLVGSSATIQRKTNQLTFPITTCSWKYIELGSFGKKLGHLLTVSVCVDLMVFLLGIYVRPPDGPAGSSGEEAKKNVVKRICFRRDDGNLIEKHCVVWDGMGKWKKNLIEVVIMAGWNQFTFNIPGMNINIKAS